MLRLSFLIGFFPLLFLTFGYQKVLASVNEDKKRSIFMMKLDCPESTSDSSTQASVCEACSSKSNQTKLLPYLDELIKDYYFEKPDKDSLLEVSEEKCFQDQLSAPIEKKAELRLSLGRAINSVTDKLKKHIQSLKSEAQVLVPEKIKSSCTTPCNVNHYVHLQTFIAQENKNSNSNAKDCKDEYSRTYGFSKTFFTEGVDSCGKVDLKSNSRSSSNSRSNSKQSSPRANLETKSKSWIQDMKNENSQYWKQLWEVCPDNYGFNVITEGRFKYIGPAKFSSKSSKGGSSKNKDGRCELEVNVTVKCDKAHGKGFDVLGRVRTETQCKKKN